MTHGTNMGSGEHATRGDTRGRPSLEYLGAKATTAKHFMCDASDVLMMIMSSIMILSYTFIHVLINCNL